MRAARPCHLRPHGAGLCREAAGDHSVGPRVALRLRCGTHVVGPPRGSGPADDAPIVLRGKALRDTFILRFLALERGVRGLLLLALAYGVWRFDGSRGALKQVFNSYLPALKPLADRFGVDLEESGPVHLIQQAFTAKHSTLLLVAVGVLAYGIASNWSEATIGL